MRASPAQGCMCIVTRQGVTRKEGRRPCIVVLGKVLDVQLLHYNDGNYYSA